MNKDLAGLIKEYVVNHERNRRLVAWICMLSICTAAGVYGWMMRPAISMESGNPLVTSDMPYGIFGQPLSAHVTATAESGLEATWFHLSVDMENAVLSEELVFDSSGMAIIQTNAGESLQLYKVAESGKKQGLWFMLYKGTEVDFDLPFKSTQVASQPVELVPTQQQPVTGIPGAITPNTEATTPVVQQGETPETEVQKGEVSQEDASQPDATQGESTQTEAEAPATEAPATEAEATQTEAEAPATEAPKAESAETELQPTGPQGEIAPVITEASVSNSEPPAVEESTSDLPVADQSDVVQPDVVQPDVVQPDVNQTTTENSVVDDQADTATGDQVAASMVDPATASVVIHTGSGVTMEEAKAVADANAAEGTVALKLAWMTEDALALMPMPLMMMAAPAGTITAYNDRTNNGHYYIVENGIQKTVYCYSHEKIQPSINGTAGYTRKDYLTEAPAPSAPATKSMVATMLYLGYPSDASGLMSRYGIPGLGDYSANYYTQSEIWRLKEGSILTYMPGGSLSYYSDALSYYSCSSQSPYFGKHGNVGDVNMSATQDLIKQANGSFRSGVVEVTGDFSGSFSFSTLPSGLKMYDSTTNQELTSSTQLVIGKKVYFVYRGAQVSGSSITAEYAYDKADVFYLVPDEAHKTYQDLVGIETINQRKQITLNLIPAPVDLKIHKTNQDKIINLQGVQFKLNQATVSGGTWSDTGVTLMTGTTDANGNMTLAGIRVGDYLLHETKPAAGYALPAEPWRLRISIDGSVTLTDSQGIAVMKTGDYYQIINRAGYELPSTGGMGTGFYTKSGVLIMTLASLIYAYNKRRNQSKDDERKGE